MSCDFYVHQMDQRPSCLHLDSHFPDAQMPNGSLNITPDYDWYTEENGQVSAPYKDDADGFIPPRSAGNRGKHSIIE